MFIGKIGGIGRKGGKNKKTKYLPLYTSQKELKGRKNNNKDRSYFRFSNLTMSYLNNVKVVFKCSRGKKIFETISIVENYSVITMWFYAYEICSFNSSIKRYLY